MFKQLIEFLKGPEESVNPESDLRIAVAVLLLEAAKMDDTFSATENAVIQKLLSEKFEISPAEAHELLASSEKRLKALVQLHPYTNECFTQMNELERIRLIEMLWEVVYADKVLDPDEDALVRRVSNLVHVSDRERMLARQRVRTRLGLGPEI